jgi:hypothetical protein
MTAISVAHAGQPDLKHPDRWFAGTIRLRTEGTDHLLAAAQAAGVSHVVAQSFGAFNGIREGGWVKTEEDPLDPGPASARKGAEALRHLEDVVLKAGGAVLRYGSLYGPGTIDDQVELVRKRQFPLVGGATGYSSWVHLDDAASGTVLAMGQKAGGVFNIVDDDPAPASEWLPYLAACAGAKRPRRVPRWLARLLAGDMAVVMRTGGRGFCNAKARRELGCVLRSARVRREACAGPWFPEPLLSGPYQDPERSAELAGSLSMAALVLLERLSPLERAVFVLREVSGFGFGEVAPAVGRSGRRRRAASSRCGRAATWTRAGPGPRPAAGSGRNSPNGSSARWGKGTSTGCGSCSPPTSMWPATAAARSSTPWHSTSSTGRSTRSAQ